MYFPLNEGCLLSYTGVVEGTMKFTVISNNSYDWWDINITAQPTHESLVSDFANFRYVGSVTPGILCHAQKCVSAHKKAVYK